MKISISKRKNLEQELNMYLQLDTDPALTNPNDFILEDEVAETLKVTSRTMYNYRKKYKIVHFKMGNRVYYSKSHFMQKINELTLLKK